MAVQKVLVYDSNFINTQISSPVFRLISWANNILLYICNLLIDVEWEYLHEELSYKEQMTGILYMNSRWQSVFNYKKKKKKKWSKKYLPDILQIYFTFRFD